MYDTGAAAEEEYIPCVTPGATQFALSRLDKEGVLGLAHKAANFRNNQLYGSPVKRITSKFWGFRSSFGMCDVFGNINLSNSPLTTSK